MSLKKRKQEELEKLSMIEITHVILAEENKAMDFHDIFEQVAEIKGFTKEQKNERLAQFYTDLNINGHFITIGSNQWGLKSWYPVEQIDEEVTAAPKKKKKTKAKKTKKAKKKEEDFDQADNEPDSDENDLEELAANLKGSKDEDDDGFDDYEDFDEEDEEDLDDVQDEDEDEDEEDDK